jgi:hypothetical protein
VGRADLTHARAEPRVSAGSASGDGNGRQFVFAWQRAILDSDLPPPARHVALTLSIYMDGKGGSAFPGATRLVHDTGQCERGVRGNLGLLVAKGWLVIVEHGGLKGEERRSNRYRATFPPMDTPSSDPCTTGTGAPDAGLPLHERTLTPAPRAPHQSIDQSINQSIGEQEKPKRKQDPIFEALCDETNTNPGELTRSSRGSLNRAAKELRNLGADAGAIASRADQYRRRYPAAALTASALVKHWPTLGDAPQPESSNGDTHRGFGPYECPLGLGCDNGNIWDAQKNGVVRCDCMTQARSA